MNLADFGYEKIPEIYRNDIFSKGLVPARVIAEHKERYAVLTEDGELDAEITGNMRFTANACKDFPAVGDWVAISVFEQNVALKHQILPRFSVIARQDVAQFGEIQLIAANIDVAFMVQAVDRDFNLNRLERYLTICYQGKVESIIVLTKTDLIEIPLLNEIELSIKARLEHVAVVKISNLNLSGIAELSRRIEIGKTYCLLGSSGVGKSSLMNNLAGIPLMKTDSISKSTTKEGI